MYIYIYMSVCVCIYIYIHIFVFIEAVSIGRLPGIHFAGRADPDNLSTLARLACDCPVLVLLHGQADTQMPEPYMLSVR